MSTDDVELLASNLKDLLSGDLKVGIGLVKVGKALGRQGVSKAWAVEGLRRWIDDNEEAIPVIAAALGEAGVDKVKAWAEKQTT